MNNMDTAAAVTTAAPTHLEACRRVIAARYRAGEPIEDIAADYAIYGFTSADIHTITTEEHQ